MEFLLQIEGNIIYYIQSILGEPVLYKDYIKKLKIFSSWKYQKIMLLVLCFFLPIKYILQTFLSILIARCFGLYFKNKLKIKRPFMKFNYIKYYGKRKEKSYSFPSMSTISTIVFYRNLSIIYNIHWVYYIILFSLGFTRIFRGLHYPHDILFSIFIGYSILLVVELLVYNCKLIQ